VFIELPESLAIMAAIHDLFKLIGRAGIRLGKMVGTSDWS
jgi:hypothetical protein